MSETPRKQIDKFGWFFALTGVAGSVWFLAYVGYMPGPSFVGDWNRWLPTYGLVILGLVGMFASLISLRSRRWAATLALIPCAVISILWTLESHHPDRHPNVPLPSSFSSQSLAYGWLIFLFLLVSGLFWLFTRKALPILARPVSAARKILGVVLLLALVPIGSVLMSVCLPGPDNWFRDLCGPPPPFTAQREPQQSVFTARILRSFSSPRWMQEGGALVHINGVFWGVPRWHKGLAVVIMPTFNDWRPFQNGPEYLVDADRLHGSLTRFLPIYRDHRCTRTAPLQDSEIQLRVLHDGLPASGLRILGETIRLRQEKDSNHYTVEKVPHVNVTIQGAGKSIAAVSDERGIYDVSGLSADYIRLGLPIKRGRCNGRGFVVPTVRGIRFVNVRCTFTRGCSSNWECPP